MSLLIKLAWRNIFRNTRRTILCGLAVGMGLAALMFVDALLLGMMDNLIRSATDSFLGQGQIHAEGFRDTQDVESVIQRYDEIAADLINGGAPGVTGWSPRTLAFGMITSTADVRNVLVYGIEPKQEAELSLVRRALQRGEYLGGTDERRLLIGSKTAEVLHVEPGDRIVLTMAQAGTGELSQELMRVAGVFHFNIREVDGGMVYLPIDTARRMLGIGDNAHEIALRFEDLYVAGDRSNPLWKKYSAGGNEAIGWRDIIPQMDAVVEMNDVSTFITVLLVFGIVGLTIMNTLFMSLYERMYEFGVMRAVGTSPAAMAGVIFLEAAALALVSILFGLVIGSVVIAIFMKTGIDYSGTEFAGVSVREPVFPVLTVWQFTLYPLLVMGFSLVAALYPALYAAKLTPARAMRKSL